MTDKPDWMKVCSGINCDSCKSRKNKGKGDCLDFNIDKYPLITKYMGWEIHTSLDGNDMVAAMNKMVEKGDWKSWFIPRAYQKWEKNCEYYFTTPEQEGYLMFITWLMQPARFFELMAKWLEARNAKVE